MMTSVSSVVMTATNPRVHDPSEAGRHPHRTQRERQPNRCVDRSSFLSYLPFLFLSAVNWCWCLWVMRPYVNCVSLSLFPGYIYVDLQSDAEVDKALQKTNDYMGGFYEHQLFNTRW